MFPKIRILDALFFALFFAGALFAGGCTSPCEQLADNICGCKPNSTEQNACKQLVQAATNQHNVPGQENRYCSSLLDKCTCDAIDENNLVACGLAKPAAAHDAGTM